MTCSKKQVVVIKSSVEVEFRVVAHEVCKHLRLKKLLEELKIWVEAPMRMYYWNKATITSLIL